MTLKELLDVSGLILFRLYSKDNTQMFIGTNTTIIRERPSYLKETVKYITSSPNLAELNVTLDCDAYYSLEDSYQPTKIKY